MTDESQIPEEGQAAVVVHTGGVPAESAPAVSNAVAISHDLLEVVKARDQFIKMAVPIAIASTSSNQWSKFGDYMRPEIGAAERILRRFGVRYERTRWEKTEGEDEKGRHYMYTFYMDMSLPNGIDLIEAMGTCGSRDKFLGTRQGTSKERPIFEVTEGDIKKKARTNCIVNGCMNLLGLHNITPAMLSKHVEGEVKNIEFKGGDKKRSTQSPRSASAPPPAQEEAPPDKDKIIASFWEQVDAVVALGASRTEMIAKYLVFKSGESPSEEDINRFHKPRALKWLQMATKEIKKNEGT